MVVIHHRNYIGQFFYQNDSQEYLAIWEDNSGEVIECYSRTRLGCLFNWIKTVNHHIKEKHQIYANQNS